MYFGPVVDENDLEQPSEDKKPKKENTKEKKVHRMSGGKWDIGAIIKEIGLPKLVLVMVCGIVIIVLSFLNLFSSSTTSKKTSSETDTSTTSSIKSENYSTTEEYTASIENRLKQILMQVKDIGEVEVMITLKSSKELVPLKDQPSEEQTTKEQDSAGGSRDSSSVSKQEETVLVESETGGSEPVIVKEIEPEIEGVVIICKGGDSEYVKSEIVDAVLALFDVPAHKIKVMKMNG